MATLEEALIAWRPGWEDKDYEQLTAELARLRAADETLDRIHEQYQSHLPLDSGSSSVQFAYAVKDILEDITDAD